MRDSTAKVAFAVYLHDLGKFAERAKLDVPDSVLNTHIQMYCPQKIDNGKPLYYTHKHAAYTAFAWDLLEQNVPDLIKGDMYPFAGRSSGEDKTDSLLNASAMHHKPETFLQWIIATADRVASGFEREKFEHYNQSGDEREQQQTGKNHYQARLLTLFEQIDIHNQSLVTNDINQLQWCYPLKPLSAENIFPKKRLEAEPARNEPAQQEYRKLWEQFIQCDIPEIPKSHRKNWHLWLDHFDTLWQNYTQAIPSATAFGTKPEVSLYDHSKTTAALAAALWRWHEACGKTSASDASRLRDRSDWDEQKILLIQGDFFGIQNFIFASGSQTNKRAAKLLRGRSFQVSLFAELAALKILEACELPPTSQVLNAAGKFMIVAPNTDEIKHALKEVRSEINDWFLQHTYGQVGLGLAYQEASCNDFVDKERFAALVKKSFAVLEKAKLQRFALTGDAPCILPADYSAHKECQYNQQLPANQIKDGIALANLSDDQITLGGLLTKHDRLMVFNQADSIHYDNYTCKLKLPIFGFHIVFTEEEELSGKFGAEAQSGKLLRCWDFSLPEIGRPLWHGYARRYINAYVPRFSEGDEWLEDKYDSQKEADDASEIKLGNPKTFNHLACEERHSEDGQNFIGKIAIATLKGDVDNLGSIFQQGLKKPTFAKMAALSRQMNHFFSLWLPAYCAQNYPNIYTVFAGGDDFFLIGPWLQTQKLAAEMREKFQIYVAENKGITFSAGIAVSKPGLPLRKLSAYAEEALEQAKAYQSACHSKNAISVYGETLAWSGWKDIMAAQEQISSLKTDYGLSTGYIYAMLEFCHAAQKEKGASASSIDIAVAGMWRSRFAYRTRRYVNMQKNIIGKEAKQNAYNRLTEAFYQNGIEKLGSKYRIPLFNHFYLLRAR